MRGIISSARMRGIKSSVRMMTSRDPSRPIKSLKNVVEYQFVGVLILLIITLIKSQFTDDTTMFLDGSRDSLIATLNTLEIFRSLSRFKVNTAKTKITWVGKKKHFQDMYDTIKNWTGVQLNSTSLNCSFL